MVKTLNLALNLKRKHSASDPSDRGTPPTVLGLRAGTVPKATPTGAEHTATSEPTNSPAPGKHDNTANQDSQGKVPTVLGLGATTGANVTPPDHSRAAKRGKRVTGAEVQAGPSTSGRDRTAPSERDTSDLLFDLQNHVSQRAMRGSDAWKVRGFGCFQDIYEIYEDIQKDEETGPILDQCGFRDFFVALRAMRDAQSNSYVVKALVERFWDTTNTFHLPVGEMYLTPTDVQVILGLPGAAEPVPFQEEWRGNDPRLFGLVGSISHYFGHRATTILCSTLKTALKDASIRENATPEQRVRLFLWCLFGQTLFPKMGSRVNFSLLESLADLSKVADYDWPGAVWATLTTSLRAAVRPLHLDPDHEVCLWGSWRILEVWLYEHIPSLGPEPREKESCYPAMRRWRTSTKFSSAEAVRVALNGLTTDQVTFKPWLKIIPTPECVQVAGEDEPWRILLRGETSEEWFLPERISRQTFQDGRLLVPHDPPLSMLTPGLHPKNEYQAPFYPYLECAAREVASEDDYEDFRIHRLAPAVNVTKVEVPLPIPSYRFEYRDPGQARHVLEILPAPESEQHGLPLAPETVVPTFADYEKLLRVCNDFAHAFKALFKERVAINPTAPQVFCRASNAVRYIERHSPVPAEAEEDETEDSTSPTQPPREPSDVSETPDVPRRRSVRLYRRDARATSDDERRDCEPLVLHPTVRRSKRIGTYPIGTRENPAQF